MELRAHTDLFVSSLLSYVVLRQRSFEPLRQSSCLRCPRVMRVVQNGPGSPKPCVRIHPRRKAADTVNDDHKMTNGGESRRKREPMTFTTDDISPYFNLPQKQACDALGVSLTSMKHICRSLGLSKWPYRRRCDRKSSLQTQTRFLAAQRILLGVGPTPCQSSGEMSSASHQSEAEAFMMPGPLLSHSRVQSQSATEAFMMPGPLLSHSRIQSAQSNLPSTTANADDYKQAVCARRNLSILQAQATSSSQLAFMRQTNKGWSTDDLSWLMTFSHSQEYKCKRKQDPATTRVLLAHCGCFLASDDLCG